MGLFGIDSTSTAKQTSTTVTDQAQLVERGARVAQSGAVLVGDKAQLAPNYTVKGRGTLTVNEGVNAGELNSLLGQVTAATSAQIAAASAANQNQLAALRDQSLQTQPPDTTAPSADTAAPADQTTTELPGWVKPTAVAVVIAAIAWLFLRK